ncbi:MAG: alpha/beta hydrolase [Actinomycetota bacterium]
MRHQHNIRRKVVVAVFALGLFASACSEPTIIGSSQDTIDDPSKISTEAPENVEDADTSSSTSIPSSGAATTNEIVWAPCKADPTGDSQCGELIVPFDYNDPSVGSFTLFLTRRLATDQTTKIGWMLVNPGGPGFGGSSVAADAQYYFSAELLSRFDVIGWDPRGTGKSTPAVNCIEEYDEYFGIDSTPETRAEKQVIVDASKKYNDECVKNSGEILPYISTQATARDMDSIRRALGEDKITYFGFSYGSELGATWATMFPDTVRAAVLDGASDPNATSLDQGLAQAKGFEKQLDTFLAACSKRVSCAFHGNGNSAAALDKLLASVDATPLVVSADRTPITQGVMYTALAQAMYSDTLWPKLERALADGVKGNGAGLLSLYDEYYQRKPGGTYGNELEAFLAISCLDDPGPIGVEAVDAQVPVFTKAAKRFGPSFAYGYSCALWPVKPVERIVITGKGAGPIIVVGTTGDAATPIASSRAAAKALEKGVFVTVRADQHTGYGLNACIVNTVDSYLTDLVVPDDGKVCG